MCTPIVGTDTTELACLDEDIGAGWGESEQFDLNDQTTYFIRVAVDAVPNMENITLSISTPAIVWTGTTDTDWYTATNWATGTVPEENDEVYIGPGLTNYPVVDNSPFSPRIELGYIHVDGGTLTLGADGLLRVDSEGDGVLWSVTVGHSWWVASCFSLRKGMA